MNTLISSAAKRDHIDERRMQTTLLELED